MKTIINIARNELRQLFYSPIAWVLIVVFFVIAGSSYTSVFGAFTRSIAAGWKIQGDLTMNMFGGYYGLFAKIQGFLYLFIPLITMGLISKDKSSGTEKLLFSSPVRHSWIVFGKFAAMMAYGAVMLSVLLVVIVFSSFTIEAFDLKPVLTGLLGLYLLLLAYSAIGIFMSSLTRYQIVAVVGTIATLFIMNYSPGVWQDVPFVRDLTFWIGLSGRCETFIAGLISSEDLIYFLTVIFMFLGLTILKVRFETVRERAAGRAIKYAAVVAAAFLIGFASSRPKLMAFYDATRMKSMTLTEGSQQALRDLDGPLTITTYVNLLENNATSALPKSYNSDVSRFAHYRRFKPEIKMKYVYYYHDTPGDQVKQYEEEKTFEQRVEDRARSYDTRLSLWKGPEDIDRTIDLSGEEYRFVRILERGDGTSSRLRMYNDMNRHPSETEITAAFKRLTVKPPRVGFVTGHRERSIFATGETGYYLFAKDITFRNALINQGFDVDTVSLSAPGPIPAGIDILVLADPRSAYSDGELEKIGDYISAGGNLLVGMKPGRREYLQPVLDNIGVGTLPGTLVSDNEDFPPELIIADITETAAAESKVYGAYAAGGYRIAAPGAVGLTVDPSKGFTASDIAVGGTDNSPLIVTLQRSVGDKEQKIVVLGDADIIGNGELMTSRTGVKPANFAVIMGSFGWLADDEFPVDTSRQRGPDDEFRYITSKDRGWMDILFICVIPGLTAVLALIMLIRRKAK